VKETEGCELTKNKILNIKGVQTKAYKTVSSKSSLPTHSALDTTDSDPLESFLSNLGFRINPFQHLEASADPHLADYAVGLESFDVAWALSPALIFAPIGGGKTAMRITTVQNVWLPLGGRHPLPVSGVPPLSFPGFPSTQAELLQFIIYNVLVALFQGLAQRPHRFFALPLGQQRVLVRFWRSYFGHRLLRYVGRLAQRNNPNDLAAVLDPAYRFHRSAASRDRHGQDVGMFCTRIRELLNGVLSGGVEAQWDALIRLVQGSLGFSGILLLVDGLDATPETARRPFAGLDWFRFLWQYALKWAEENVFIKGFLPLEYREEWQSIAPSELTGVEVRELRWNPSLLTQMVQRRIQVATDGKASSLDAFSSPGLRDVESRLAWEVVPLPREMLALTREVLLAWYQRQVQMISAPFGAFLLDGEDIQVGIRQYRASAPQQIAMV